MSVALHILIRPLLETRSPLADDIQRSNAHDDEVLHRVVELASGGVIADPVDLGNSAEDQPELLAILSQASEVHLYGFEVHVALRLLPYVLPETLQETPLYVHGPCVSLSKPKLSASSMRLSAWPGPLHYDAPALASLQDLEENTPVGAPTRIPIDPFDASLWPCAGERGPIEGLAQDAAVVVCLSSRVPQTKVSAMQQALEPVFSAHPGNIDVAWIEERQVTSQQARVYRRLAQVCVAWGWSDPVCAQAIAAGTPLWVMNSKEDDALSTWWQSKIGLKALNHQLAGLDEAEFLATWRTAMEVWAKGQGLEVPTEPRAALLGVCLAPMAA